MGGRLNFTLDQPGEFWFCANNVITLSLIRSHGARSSFSTKNLDHGFGWEWYKIGRQDKKIQESLLSCLVLKEFLKFTGIKSAFKLHSAFYFLNRINDSTSFAYINNADHHIPLYIHYCSYSI